MLKSLKAKKYFIFCILAAVSAAIVAAADYLLEYTGNTETITFIDPYWTKMASWRFPLSLNLCAFVIPSYILGFWVIRRLLASTHSRMANVYFGTASYGVIMGASFIHSVLCYFPIIYQKLAGAGQKSLAEDVINSIMNAIMPVFVVHYILSWIIPQILLFVLVISGKTKLNRWTAFLNPFAFLVFGLLCSLIAPQALQFVYVGIINKGNVALFVLAAVYEYKEYRRNSITGFSAHLSD